MSDFTPEEARKALYGAARVRMPRLRTEEGQLRPREKIEKLEDHMVLCARWIGVLEEHRLYMYDAVRSLEDEWDKIEGWQVAKDPKDKSAKAEVNAKRQIRPDLYAGIREGKWIAARLSEQINRLERDQEWAVSRTYTMIGGGS